MTDITEGETGRRVVHGLRHVASGRMVRVREIPSIQDDEVSFRDVTYAMTLDEHCPVYDAGSPEGLAMAFAPTYGGSARRPVRGDVSPGDVVPVRVEEVTVRDERPLPVEFETAEQLVSFNSFTPTRAIASRCEGLGDVMDLVREHRAELEAVAGPGGEWPAGRFSLVGVTVPADADAMPDLMNRLVVTNGTDYPVRRALATLPLPRDLLQLAGFGGAGRVHKACVVVCLSDERPLPEGFLAALSPSAGPAPR